MDIHAAYEQLKISPFEDLGYAKIDHHRHIRQGAAEVIYGAGKTVGQITASGIIVVATGGTSDIPVAASA